MLFCFFPYGATRLARAAVRTGFAEISAPRRRLDYTAPSRRPHGFTVLSATPRVWYAYQPLVCLRHRHRRQTAFATAAVATVTHWSAIPTRPSMMSVSACAPDTGLCGGGEGWQRAIGISYGRRACDGMPLLRLRALTRRGGFAGSVEQEITTLSPFNRNGLVSDIVVRIYFCPACVTSFSSDVQYRCIDLRTPEMHVKLDKPQRDHPLKRAHASARQFIRKTAAIGLGTP